MTDFDQVARDMALNDIETLDDLGQAFAELKMERLKLHFAAIILAHIADTFGPAGRSKASDNSDWTAQTITRLAMQRNLPPELIDRELKHGVYWVVMMSDLSQAEQWAMLAKAIKEKWSVADAKEALGLESERTGGTVYNAKVTEHDGPRAVITGEELATGRLEPGVRVSVRMLKSTTPPQADGVSAAKGVL